MQNGLKWCKSSWHEVASEFFTMNAPDPTHGTLNSCFGVFCTIWMHLGPFGCLSKLSAKQAELVQKFVSRSRVEIFRNERTRSSPLDSKLMFWCVSYYLGAFGTVSLPYKPWCKTGWSGAKVRAMKSCLQQTIRSTPLDSNLLFLCVSYYLGTFGTVCCVTTLSSKRAKLEQKFVPRCRVGIFHNERTRSTPWDSKLMFWCVLYYLAAFGTVWLPYKTQCKTGRSGAKVRAMKSCWNFWQQTHPIHPFGPLPHVSVHFVLFGCISDRLLPYNTQFKTSQTSAKVSATKSRRNFSQWTHPIHAIGL